MTSTETLVQSPDEQLLNTQQEEREWEGRYWGDIYPPDDDPFYYGWREVFQTKNGTTELVYEPLTLADVLHPQWGDYVMQCEEHFLVCNDLYNGLTMHLAHEHHTVILHDTPIDWEGAVKALCPDLAVIREVQQRFPKGTFYVLQSKGHVDMVLEVTSRSTRKVDVDGQHPVNKVQKYAQVGVPYYIIVDDARRKEGYAPALTVYQLQEGKGYQRQEPDKRGWYWITPVELWIGAYADWVSWYDEHGEKIGTLLEVAHAREQAEVQAQAEAHAREQAEARTYIAEARAHVAEARAHVAEAQAQAEAHAREQAEDQIRQLKALLRKAGLE